MQPPTALLNETVTAAPVTGRDVFGKPTFGAQTTEKARVEWVQKSIRDAKGTEHTSSAVVYVTAALGLDHAVWLPGTPTTLPAAADYAKRVLVLEVHKDRWGKETYRKLWV